EPLHGEVEIDATWVGGTQAGIRGSRQLRGRRAALVVVAVEKRGRASGRTRMAVIPDFRATTINSFVTRNVAPGSTIHTDGLKSFAGLQELGFKHIPRTQSLESRIEQRYAVGGATRRSRHRQPPAMAHRHSSRGQPRATPGLPRRVRL